ncbi:hypothetical protein CKAH01_04442 [Colletotrichum kahawae]|uniref:Uncharacterized protein n=1 Tax=Colletotrichum kahawae TaxID=34407 RepID=A0AAE0D9M6_COLKA|nr:hypothetical protein CKAH01_04442 [Colletotrichum kahawae]
MRRRIEKVCKGHMNWLFKDKAGSSRKTFFGPNYWVSGEEIEGWRNNEYLPSKSLVDTAFQIIKAGDFYKMSRESNHITSIETTVDSWLEDLDKVTDWGHYMFPRYDSQPTRTFHLTDHALIWRAIRSAEDMNIRPHPGLANRDYSSQSLQRAIMKGFTVNNHSLQNDLPMLAVMRGLALNRFTLRPSESALVLALESGFFDESQEKQHFEQWKNTINNQSRLEDSHNDTSNDPRAFAARVLPLGEYLEPESENDPFLSQIIILLQSFSANGLFPGNLDHQKKPAMYQNDSLRDKYWSNVFEIPYILWKCCSGPNFGSPSTSTQVIFDSLRPSSHAVGGVSAHAGDLSGKDIRSTPPRTTLRRTNSTKRKASSTLGMRVDPNTVLFERELFLHGPAFLYHQLPFRRNAASPKTTP